MMLAESNDETNHSRHVSIRYDDASRTYYCFYRRTEHSPADLTLSYDLNERKWLVETYEYKQRLERTLNDTIVDQNMPFEEQYQSVIDYLDTHFVAQPQERQMKPNGLFDRFYRFSWLRGIRNLRRYASQNALLEHSPSSPACLERYKSPPSSDLALQRRSAPSKSSRISEYTQPIPVKALAESWYADKTDRQCTLPFTNAASDHYSKALPDRLLNRPPSIAEIWLNIVRPNRENGEQHLIASSFEAEENWTDLAEKFVRLFGGTFQCDIGHTYQLNYKNEIWQFIVAGVELMASMPTTSKVPKTKIIFLIDGIPYHVRG